MISVGRNEVEMGNPDSCRTRLPNTVAMGLDVYTL